MNKLAVFLCLTIFALAVSLSAQVRPVEPADKPEKQTREDKEEENKDKIKINKEALKNLPQSYKVKYQGGLFGFSKKQKGTIRFDDINERLLFFGKDGKEKFSIPYDVIMVVHPSHKKVQSGTGRAVGATPVPGAGLVGRLIKKKKNYLVVRFEDPDVKATGNINFLLDTEKLLTSAINTIGRKAEMKPRGDAYIRSEDF